jgi:hypothetical protein
MWVLQIMGDAVAEIHGQVIRDLGGNSGFWRMWVATQLEIAQEYRGRTSSRWPVGCARSIPHEKRWPVWGSVRRRPSRHEEVRVAGDLLLVFSRAFARAPSQVQVVVLPLAQARIVVRALAQPS